MKLASELHTKDKIMMDLGIALDRLARAEDNLELDPHDEDALFVFSQANDLVDALYDEEL